MLTGQRLTAIVAALALVIAGGLAVYGVLGLGGDPSGQSAQAQSIGEERGIRVDAEGQVSVEPDTARVTVGIEVEGQDIDELRETANGRMNDVIAALQDAGIDEADIRTVAYDIYTRDDDGRPPEPLPDDAEEDPDDSDDQAAEPTYRLIQLLQVKVTDIDMTGDVIDVALDNGANRINGIRFEVEDRAAAIEQARELAVENARAKAEHLAELTGVNLGAPLAIQERSPSMPAVGYGDAAIEQEMAAADMAAPVQPGESVITVNVNIVYGIE